METQEQSTQLVQAPRLKYHSAIQENYGIDRASWKTLVEAIFPNAPTTASVELALAYCRDRKLDPFKRPVHIVPMWHSGLGRMVETVWPGISELRTTAFRTKNYAGIDAPEFGPMKKRNFKGAATKGKLKGQERACHIEFPEWCRVTVYRIVDGQRCAFVGPMVRWLEAYATWADTDVPNDMWRDRPEGQLEKCAEAAALRRAFPEELGDMPSAEEMAGRRYDDPALARDVTPPPADMGPPQAPASADNSEPLLGELRAALLRCTSEPELDAAVEAWSAKAGDIPPALEEALAAAIQTTKARLSSTKPPAQEPAPEEPKAKRGRPAKAKPQEEPKAAQPEPQGEAKEPEAPKAQGPQESAPAAPPQEEQTPPQEEQAAPPPEERPRHDALLAALRAKHSAPEALKATFEAKVAPWRPYMPEQQWTELCFVYGARMKLMGAIMGPVK